jgi:photosystem II stability/assembly factor-like uncharacterized protein
MGLNPLLKGGSRVFTIEGRARGDHVPVYRSCLRAGAEDWSFGDVTKIECPDPDKHNSWVQVGQYQSAIARVTSDLQGRYALDEESYLLRIAKTRCPLDYHVHYGECTNPSDFNVFTKAKVYANALFTNHSTDEEGALSSDAQGEVNETVATSAEEVYEILPLGFSERGADAVTNPIVDVVICDTASCGDCEEESDGCQKIYAVDDGSTGSPGTAPDVLYSLDKGAAWAAEDVDSLAAAEPATGIACVGIYLVVTSNVDGGVHWKERALIGDGATNWVRVALVPAGAPNDIWSVGNYAFIVGDGGYVYGTADPTVAGVVLDAGVAAVTEDLNAVHAISDQFAVAVGDNDTVIFTQNQTFWTAVVGPGGGNYLCVWVKNEEEWWVGDDAGALYYTLDQGVTWAEKGLPGAGWTAINDIQFPKDGVGFMAADKVGTPRGFLLRSFDGGYSWVVLPQLLGAMPLADSFLTIATCTEDVNFVVAGGEADALGDGIIVTGMD